MKSSRKRTRTSSSATTSSPRLDAAVRRPGRHLHPSRPGLGGFATTPGLATTPTTPRTRRRASARRPNNSIVPGFTPSRLAVRRRVAHRARLHQPLPAVEAGRPFAGATRNLCDRKEVTLSDQTRRDRQVLHLHLDSQRVEVHRRHHRRLSRRSSIRSLRSSVRSSLRPTCPSPSRTGPVPKSTASTPTGGAHYNGMTYSTWEVNPPNPTGYSPNMMIFCMNDKGSRAVGGPATVTDPLFNPRYSQFCYELPFMPGTTHYLDTPVVPTSAFLGWLQPPRLRLSECHPRRR